MKKRNTGIRCPVCGGFIIERSTLPYIPRRKHGVIDPGFENIATEKDRIIDGFYCAVCKTEFHKLPPSIGRHQ